MTRICLAGSGMVGGTLLNFLRTKNIEPTVYDPPKGKHDPTVMGEADVIFVSVPTPYYLDGSGFDDSFIRDVVKVIPVLDKTIVLKSTVTPGTTEAFQKEFPMHRFLFNPEFLTETRADEDMQHPNRQIVGYTTESRRDAEMVMDMLPRAPFEKIIPAREAEMIKYFGNAFYALKVAYANQMYDLCQKLGLDYETVKACASAEPMVGGTHLEVFHKGYRGYGGKCLPKDVRAILQIAKKNGVDLSLLREAETYNNPLVSNQGLDIEWQEGSPKK